MASIHLQRPLKATKLCPWGCRFFSYRGVQVFFCSLLLESPQYSLPSGFYWPGPKLGKYWSELVVRLSDSTQGQPCQGCAFLLMAQPWVSRSSDGHDFSTGRLSSTSSTSSCSSEYSGEVIPHGPGKCHLSWLRGTLLPVPPWQILLEVTQPLLWDEAGVAMGLPRLQ